MDPGTVKVGDRIPPFRRPSGFAAWNRYAAVNDEFIPIHMDDEAGQAAGYPTAFGMGNLQWSYLHNVLRQWMGDDGEILDCKCQFRSPNLKGQIVTAHGTVTEVSAEGDRMLIYLDVWTEDQTGQVLVPGNARVAFPSRPANTSET